MFITKPIELFDYKDSFLKINESTFCFSKNKDDEELLESLISKGAYATALLYLNKNHILESINGNKINSDEYTSYLKECKDLLKENVYDVSVPNLKPLCNIDSLEILESDNCIFRGKNKLFLEDFREEHFSDDVNNAINSFRESKNKEDYIKALDKISELEWNNVITTDEYDRAIKKVQSIMRELRSNGELSGELYSKESLDEDGTQASDIAPKVDQELSGLVKPPKHYHESYTFEVPYYHSFKGFTMNEDGKYVRGNYILINECDSIKAVHKNELVNEDVDDNGNVTLSHDDVDARVLKLLNRLSAKLPNYDFDYRIEGNQLILYDKDENFDFTNLDNKDYEILENEVKKLFGHNCYLEAQTPVIGVVAGMYIE